MKESIEARLARLEERTSANAEKVVLALTASEKAIDKADDATTKRFEAVNEFRSTLSDQAAHFVTKDVADGKNELLKGEINILKIQMSRMVGIAIGASAVISLLITLSALILRLATGH